MVLLDTETPITSREIFGEVADDGARTQSYEFESHHRHKECSIFHLQNGII